MMIRSIRSFSLLTFSLATAFALGQDTAQKVTFTAKAGSAKQVLEALSKQTGVTFSTAPQTEGEILLVSVKDVPLTDLMKQLAKAAAAEWQPEGEGFRLIRPQGMHNQQEREYYDARAAKVKKAQEGFQDALNKQKPLTPAEAARIAQAQARATEDMRAAVTEGRSLNFPRMDPATMNANPTTRLLLRLLTSFAPADFARIPSGSRVVFSSAPTRAQRPLPSAAGRAITDFAREADVWLNAMPKTSSPAGDDPTRGFVLAAPGGTIAPMEGGIGKILLVVQRNVFNDSLQTEVKVADQSGKIVANSMRMIPVLDSLPTQLIRSSSDPQANPAPAPAPASPGKPLEVSAASREHAAYMMQSPSRNQIMFMTSAVPGGGASRSIAITATADTAFSFGGSGNASPKVPMTSQWQGPMLRPDQNDPMSYAVSDLFLSLANVSERNIVASLPDSALIALSQRAQQRITDTQLLEIAKGNLELTVDDAEGWLNIRPQSPFFNRSIRVDRKALGQMLAGIQKDGRLTLDNLSRYALSRTQPAPNPAFDLRYVNALFSSEASDFQNANQNWKMLQLYATLSADQRRSLSNGGVLNLGGLAPRQSAIVNAMVYDDAMGPMFLQNLPRTGPERREERSMVFAAEGGMVFSTGSAQTLMNERTEFLPGGVPSNGTLALRVSTQEAVLASRKDGSVDPRFFSAESYGAYQGIAPNIVLAGNSGGNNTMPTYDQFRSAVQQSLDFLFQFTPQASLSRQLQDAWFIPGSTAGAYGMLPESFRKKADETAAQMKDNRGTIRLGAPSGGVRPPAPLGA